MKYLHWEIFWKNIFINIFSNISLRNFGNMEEKILSSCDQVEMASNHSRLSIRDWKCVCIMFFKKRNILANGEKILSSWNGFKLFTSVHSRLKRFQWIKHKNAFNLKNCSKLNWNVNENKIPISIWQNTGKANTSK